MEGNSDEYRSDVWTGGNDFQTSRDYRWSDGSAMNYKYWFPDEPDYSDNCVEIEGGNAYNFKGWRNRYCLVQLMFICEFETS
ncbi:C-type mannose receptor 2 [Mactra antiquata]